jgi:hypothetical protein
MDPRAAGGPPASGVAPQLALPEDRVSAWFAAVRSLENSPPVRAAREAAAAAAAAAAGGCASEAGGGALPVGALGAGRAAALFSPRSRELDWIGVCVRAGASLAEAADMLEDSLAPAG